MVNKALIYLLILVISVLGALFYAEMRTRQAVLKERAEQQLIWQQAYTIASQKAREKEKDLTALVQKEVYDKNKRVKALNNSLNSVLDELRKERRDSRRESEIAGNPPSCTGATLPSEDAGFLAREAARADSILDERDFYYRSYESIRRYLDKAPN